MKAKKVSNFLNEKKSTQRKSLKYIEENILEPIAYDLGEELEYVKRDKHEGMGKKVTRRFYKIGPVQILVVDTKVAGVEKRDPEIILLDSKDPSKGTKFNPMNGYDGLEEAIEDEYLTLTGYNIDDYEDEEGETPLYDNWKK